MDEDISEEEYQEWDQSLRRVEKRRCPGGVNSNGEREHREGNSLKSMNSQNGVMSSKILFPTLRRKAARQFLECSESPNNANRTITQ